MSWLKKLVVVGFTFFVALVAFVMAAEPACACGSVEGKFMNELGIVNEAQAATLRSQGVRIYDGLSSSDEKPSSYYHIDTGDYTTFNLENIRRIVEVKYTGQSLADIHILTNDRWDAWATSMPSKAADGPSGNAAPCTRTEAMIDCQYWFSVELWYQPGYQIQLFAGPDGKVERVAMQEIPYYDDSVALQALNLFVPLMSIFLMIIFGVPWIFRRLRLMITAK